MAEKPLNLAFGIYQWNDGGSSRRNQPIVVPVERCGTVAKFVRPQLIGVPSITMHYRRSGLGADGSGAECRDMPEAMRG